MSPSFSYIYTEPARMRNIIRNYIIAAILYFRSLLDTLKISLGFMKVKYGITGYFKVRDAPFNSRIYNKERIEEGMRYDKFRPDDVVVCTYPKSGTHFTMDIIWAIYKEKGLISRKEICALEFRPKVVTQHSIASTKGRTGPLAVLEATQSPRVIATHLSWDMLPPKIKDGKVKVIHCSRNPKDVACSGFPFLKKIGILRPDVQWEDFFVNFVEGHSMGGSYMKYLKQWYPHRNMASMLNLQFEDMKMDLKGNVKRIAEFLEVDLTDDQLETIAVANTFENKMKEAGRGAIAYRKGKSGGWKSDFSVEQNEIMDEWIEAEMKGMEDLKMKYE